MTIAPPSLAECRTLLAQLIAFDTTSRNSNLALIAFVKDLLASWGVEPRLVHSEDGAKANLYAVIGPAVAGGIVLSGHTDVVPVDGQAWASDPWTLTERNGRLYGRGTADMKSFLALALAHVPYALSRPLQRPVILAFSYDEEVGCLGVRSMIAELAERLPKPRAVIVGEPTMMKAVRGHKGIRTFEVEVLGREAHSSQTHLGVSAVEAAVELMALVWRMNAEAAADADPASPFEPKGPTMTVGRVEGGTAVNILAGKCTFLWDLRCPPGIDPDPYEMRFRDAARALDARLKARAPEAGVQVRRRSDTPSFAPEPNGAAEALARALTGDNSVTVAPYAAEAGLFQGAGFSTIICGPGDIAQAHQPDEWIALNQLEAGAGFLRRLIDGL
jgi:acetylornithine deacetylase